VDAVLGVVRHRTTIKTKVNVAVRKYEENSLIIYPTVYVIIGPKNNPIPLRLV